VALSMIFSGSRACALYSSSVVSCYRHTITGMVVQGTSYAVNPTTVSDIGTDEVIVPRTSETSCRRLSRAPRASPGQPEPNSVARRTCPAAAGTVSSFHSTYVRGRRIRFKSWASPSAVWREAGPSRVCLGRPPGGESSYAACHALKRSLSSSGSRRYW